MKMLRNQKQPKRPDIGKRILPLLDIVFILLAFFIVLPHGVKSNEMLEINSLRSKNQEVQQELEYYRWKYGESKELSNKVHKVLTVKIKNNEYTVDKDILSPNKNTWKDEITKKIEVSRTTFVMIKSQGGNSNNTVEQLQKFLYKMNIIYIIEVDDNW